MSSRVLIVDDDPDPLLAYTRILKRKFDVVSVASGAEGLECIQSGEEFSVIISDIRMPVMDGIEFLTQASQESPDTVRIAITGNADLQSSIDAVNKGGVFQFLTKPIRAEALTQAVTNGVRQFQLIQNERDLLKNTLNGSIRVLIDILSIVEPNAIGRGQKIRKCVKTYDGCFKGVIRWQLELAAMLLNIGYAATPPSVLVKHREGHNLIGSEKDMVTRMPEIGSRLLEKIPRLEKVAQIILYQNKNYDGSGFPKDSVSGDEIPLESRILRILADITQLKEQGMSEAKAIAHLQAAGTAYDPTLLETIRDFSKHSDDSEEDIMEVGIIDLRLNNVLASSIDTMDGLKIVESGTLITQAVLERIKNISLMAQLKEPIYIKQ